MGLEIATIAAISAGISAVGTVVGFVQAERQQDAAESRARRAADLRRQEQKERAEARNVEQAAQQAQAARERRRAERERRVKVAQIQQSAETSGAGGSSGALGAAGVLGTNLASTVAASRSTTKAIEGINASNQRALNARVGAANVLSQPLGVNNLFGNILTTAGSFGQGNVNFLSGLGDGNTLNQSRVATSHPGQGGF